MPRKLEIQDGLSRIGQELVGHAQLVNSSLSSESRACGRLIGLQKNAHGVGEPVEIAVAQPDHQDPPRCTPDRHRPSESRAWPARTAPARADQAGFVGARRRGLRRAGQQAARSRGRRPAARGRVGASCSSAMSSGSTSGVELPISATRRWLSGFWGAACRHRSSTGAASGPRADRSPRTAWARAWSIDRPTWRSGGPAAAVPSDCARACCADSARTACAGGQCVAVLCRPQTGIDLVQLAPERAVAEGHLLGHFLDASGVGIGGLGGQLGLPHQLVGIDLGDQLRRVEIGLRLVLAQKVRSSSPTEPDSAAISSSPEDSAGC